MAILLWSTQRLGGFYRLLRNVRTLGVLSITAALIGINWYVFIVAVDTNRLTEASFGYYINPLVSVALGMFFLGERLRPLQWSAIIIAVVAVGILALRTGGLPWISLVLAGSFAFYGLLRKQVTADAPTGLFVEMLLLFPFMLVLLLIVHGDEGTAIAEGPGWLVIMLLLGGPVTIIPLLLFTGCARRLKLATVGLLQYIAPSGQLLLGVLAFDEDFGLDQAIAFGMIWIAVIIYSADTWRRSRQVIMVPEA